jgi:hypothetical protein
LAQLTQTYFDVDTNVVLKRIAMSMFPRDNFIEETCQGQIDLYGPFWSLTTLITVLYTTSTLSASITQYLADPEGHSNLPLLSTALLVIYLYGLGVPTALWAVARWLGMGEWGPAEFIGTYGYAMTIYIPVSLLCLAPLDIARWILVGAAGLLSGYFL